MGIKDVIYPISRPIYMNNVGKQLTITQKDYRKSCIIRKRPAFNSSKKGKELSEKQLKI